MMGLFGRYRVREYSNALRRREPDQVPMQKKRSQAEIQLAPLEFGTINIGREDILVLVYPQTLTPTMAAKLREAFNEALPGIAKALALEGNPSVTWDTCVSTKGVKGVG